MRDANCDPEFLVAELARERAKLCELQGELDEALWQVEDQRKRADEAGRRVTELTAALEGCWSALVAHAPHVKTSPTNQLRLKVYGALGRDLPKSDERAARPGEMCKCGRPAQVVFYTEKFGEVPWCGEYGDA